MSAVTIPTLLLRSETAARAQPSEAVADALRRGVEHLISLQQPNGSIADRGHATAMTSLAVMAMASIGVLPDLNSPQGQACHRALEFVLNPRNQKEGYLGFRDGSRMYGHGITTLMLTELLGMGTSIDQNERMRQRVSDALDVILRAQRISKPAIMQGGWRYTPISRDSDLSVSVWQIMALRSAKNDGIPIASDAIEAAVEYLEKSFAGGGFAYTPDNAVPTFAMTASGLLAMQTCGRYDSPLVANAATWLLKNAPTISARYFFYGMYYYAQGMHQVGGETARVAESTTSGLLLARQDRNGGWIGHQGDESNNGSVYATTLAMLALSVRYHYLPIYQR